jgi:hypothetical protein
MFFLSRRNGPPLVRPRKTTECYVHRDRKIIQRFYFVMDGGRRTPSISVILTKSANDLVPIFFMM